MGKAVPLSQLGEWEEPAPDSFKGHYFGGLTVRVTNGRRNFILTLDRPYEGELYNFAANFKDGTWSNSTKKAPELRITAVHEVFEVFAEVFPNEGDLDLTILPAWKD